MSVFGWFLHDIACISTSEVHVCKISFRLLSKVTRVNKAAVLFLGLIHIKIIQFINYIFIDKYIKVFLNIPDC